jgi:hypothetical protein
MWTAIILASVVAGGTAAYAAWSIHAIAQGAPMWPFIVGIPFAYLAVPLLLTYSGSRSHGGSAPSGLKLSA